MCDVKCFWVSSVILVISLLSACAENGEAGPSGGDTSAPPPAVSVVVTPMIVGGDVASFALKRDGTVVAWGDQENGALGNGKAAASSTRVPQPVLNLTGITQIAAGSSHGMARRNDGAVFVWGANASGQLGVGGGGFLATPVQLELSNIIAVATGADFSLALRTDGVVFAWGDNSAGQLGLGDNAVRLSPEQIPNLSGVIALAAGGSHALAIRSDKAVFAWGNNGDGQLGLGDRLPRDVPTQVPALNGLNIKQVAAGEFHSLALAANGTVHGWGSSLRGQAGSGFGTSVLPLEVTDLTRAVIAIAAGAKHSLAILDDGTMRTWGDNGSGRLGNGASGSTSASTFLPQDPGLSTVAAIGAGGSHSLVILTDGSVGCFGDNFFSQCGQSLGFSEVTTPTGVGTTSIGDGSPVLNVNQ